MVMRIHSGINNFIHIIIHVHDLKRAYEFYSAIFSWSFPEFQETDRQMIFQIYPGGDFMSGTLNVVPNDVNLQDGGIILYVNVEELLGSRERVLKHGGQIIDDIFSIEGVPGKLIIFADPFGNRFGLWSEN